MSDLLAPDIVSRLVGVIDLLDGRAVHAVAGDRDHYASVKFCGGNALGLAHHYRQLGVDSIYVADLNAIRGQGMQLAVIDSIVESTLGSGDSGSEMLLDIGFSGEETTQSRSVIADLAGHRPQIRWVAATESCASNAALDDLAELVSPQHALLGLDFRQSELVTRCGDDAGEWIHRAVELGFAGTVILDLAGVGTSCGPVTSDVCRRVRELAPSLAIYSGGGIRGADDVRRLLQAGCGACLVATALHRFQVRS